jgi:hypothetical protein
VLCGGECADKGFPVFLKYHQRRNYMAICIILGITSVYITVVLYLYLTAEMPDLPDWEEDG